MVLQFQSEVWFCYVLEKSFSHMNKCIHVYIFLKSSFPKTWSPNIQLPLQARFLDWRLTRFGKELIMYCILAMDVGWDMIPIRFFNWLTNRFVAIFICTNQTGRTNEMSVRPSPIPGDRGIQTNEVKPYFNQINYLKIDTCHILARHSALLGYDKDWSVQWQDNVIEWDRITGHGADGLVISWGQHYKVSMKVHCHTVVPIRIWPEMLRGSKTATTNRPFVNRMDIVVVDYEPCAQFNHFILLLCHVMGCFPWVRDVWYMSCFWWVFFIEERT